MPLLVRLNLCHADALWSFGNAEAEEVVKSEKKSNSHIEEEL
jgi:hypothetical protein